MSSRTVYYARIVIEHAYKCPPSVGVVADNLRYGSHDRNDSGEGNAIDTFVSRSPDKLDEAAAVQMLEDNMDRLAIDADITNPYFKMVIEFAKSVNALPEFVDQLVYLGTYGERDGSGRKTRCKLSKDFAPYSFLFTVERLEKDGNWKEQVNGGLIYSGPGQPLDGSFPALTVSLGKQDKVHSWSTHT